MMLTNTNRFLLKSKHMISMCIYVFKRDCVEIYDHELLCVSLFS